MAFWHKPKHPKNVVATENGWIVEETGELLVSFKNLKSTLDSMFSKTVTPEATETTPVIDTEASVDVVDTNTQDTPSDATESITEANNEVIEETPPQSEVVEPAKKRGRPKATSK